MSTVIFGSAHVGGVPIHQKIRLGMIPPRGFISPEFMRFSLAVGFDEGCDFASLFNFFAYICFQN